MINPYMLRELAKANQRELIANAALWQKTHPTKTNKFDRPGLIKRFIIACDTLLKKIIVRQTQEGLSRAEHLILNNNT